MQLYGVTQKFDSLFLTIINHSLSLFLQTAPKKGTTFQGPFVIFIDYNAAFELTILGRIPWQNVSAVLLFNY